MSPEAYRHALSQLVGTAGRPLAECGAWPLVHSSATAGFRKTMLTVGGPALVSRAARGNARADANDDWVFAYVAPRLKPGRQDAVVLVLKPALEGVMECAHPFDSGGLRRLSQAYADLKRALVFGADWRAVLATYVTALFDHSDAYLEGRPPSQDDPTGIAATLRSSGLPHDPLHFTWEAKTLNTIPLSTRLRAVLVSRDHDGRPRIDDECYQALLRMARREAIVVSVVDANALEFQLRRSFATCVVV
jgi:hypothetical protein